MQHTWFKFKPPKPAAREMRIPVDSLWSAVLLRYDARAKSLDLYRQQTVKFMKYADRHGIRNVDEVTRDFAEEYARWLFPRVTTAQKHIGTLRREWALLFPDSTTNPWNLGIRLQPKEKDRAMNYRALTFNEVRRVRQTAAKLAADPLLRDRARLRLLQAPLLLEICDAVVLSYRYGLRIGSVAAIRCCDFRTESGTWIHRPPKTSRATLGMDYPIVPEVAELLARRGITASQAGQRNATSPLLPEFARAYSSAEQKLNLAIKAIFRLAGVEDSTLKGRASWHSLRATFITRLTEAGCPHPIVRELAQHARGDVTQRYIHTSMATKLKWLSCIPPLGDIDLDALYPTEPEL